jgi:hypothetical protein
MSSDVASYEYLPLRPATQPDGEFRVLTILPGRRGSTIECTLQQAFLSSPPPYEALSYTWGNPKGKRNTVPVQGDPDRKFGIKLDRRYATIIYNLEAAIQQSVTKPNRLHFGLMRFASTKTILKNEPNKSK